MYDILYYIFSVSIISSSLFLAFSRNILNSAFALLLTLIASCGIYILLNSELFALVCILTLSGITLILLIFTPSIRTFFKEVQIKLPSVHFIFIIIISLLTSIVSSLISSTRWGLFEINFDTNSFSLVFSKYFPLILTIILILSVIITSSGYLLKKPGRLHK
jgi:NADH:ubiquinone oxidoreductase subunit 6 (subunit J)